MDSSWERPSDLSVLAPPAEVDEALSSWLVRTAEAHLLTISEFERELRGSISELDRGNLASLPRLAIMMRTEVAVLSEMILSDFLRQPGRAGPRPPHCWAICPYCLGEDIAQGRAAHVRRIWTHPLAVYCWLHRVPLVPHGNSDIKIANELTLFGHRKPYEPRDSLLSRSHFDAKELIQYTCDLLEDSSKKVERELFAGAVSDIVDAIATNMYTPNLGPAIRLIETPMARRRSLAGSNEMPEKWCLDVNARERLFYVRMALIFLVEPEDLPAPWYRGSFGEYWFETRYLESGEIGDWSARYDPLILLATELPRNAVRTIGHRSSVWPQRLRQRWAAVVAGATFRAAPSTAPDAND
ncbi:TniQ family protein [Caulobacter sp. Root487D2Y]|uniref:TniQ family protein n=1 Tax=Caulobacter sp. Root487D2Y TaxID=1736547 RepID=UPI000B18941A|nr:TniQ family protein [Caulobacter sp. Root487D2Y]